MKILTAKDIKAAADMLSVDVPTVMAVSEVESAGGGFFANGTPKILFEAHVFSRLTARRYDKTHPNISSPVWNRKLYLGGEKEHARLQSAVVLDRNAALQSASWGMFQIMGFNHARCGFSELQKFINAMYENEGCHLLAFCRFVLSMGLSDELQRKDWAGFASVYNGPAYAVNRYDEKLARSYARFVRNQR